MRKNGQHDSSSKAKQKHLNHLLLSGCCIGHKCCPTMLSLIYVRRIHIGPKCPHHQGDITAQDTPLRSGPKCPIFAYHCTSDIYLGRKIENFA